MTARRYPQIRTLATLDDLRSRLGELHLDLALDDDLASGPDAPLAQPFTVGDRTVGNRWTVLPMEGWDGTRSGAPTELVERRWRRFGESGAKLIWGGEAVAVRADGRANPNQLRIGEDTVDALADLRLVTVAAHEQATGRVDDLLLGLQLTHSGRWARPDGAPAARVARRDPVLDPRVGVADDQAVLRDDELDELVEDVVAAAVLAHQAGFAFVDVKACHGYLGHELLSRTEPGRYGGADLAARARFHVTVLERIRARVPDLLLGVRLSAFDLVPHAAGPDGVGVPATTEPAWRFGTDASGTRPDLVETHALVEQLVAAGAAMVCVTGGSPYYNPHIQRPAFFPPSDGYEPPEDPLCGVVGLIDAAAAIKARHPDLVVVGSGYSYLQEWVGAAAQAQVRLGHVDSVGLGRMALSYPELPLDVLAGRPLQRRKLCRTFSDCTTAPRHGLVSGCYPLDAFYKDREERVTLAAIKRERRAASRGEGDPAGD